jgi:hypothetical protein
MQWPEEEYEVSTTIDMLRSMRIYVEKEPPKYDIKTRKFYFKEGEPIEGVPYAKDSERIDGTRVYLDGKLMGAVKRNQLSNDLMEGEKYSLSGYLKSIDVDPFKVTAADFLGGDTRLSRLDQTGSQTLMESQTFGIKEGNQGRIDLQLPGVDEPSPSSVTAIQLFVRYEPRKDVDYSIRTGELKGSAPKQPEK